VPPSPQHSAPSLAPPSPGTPSATASASTWSGVSAAASGAAPLPPTRSAPGESAELSRTDDPDSGATAALPSMRAQTGRAAGSDGGGGQQIGAAEGSSAHVSYPVAPEEFPVITRMFVGADGVARGGQEMYALFGADIYLLPVWGLTGKEKEKPRLHTDFRGAECVQLQRLPPGSRDDAVEEAVSLFQTGEKVTCAVRIAGAVLVKDNAADVVVVLDSPKTAVLWRESLRSRVTPWALIQVQMEDACRSEGRISRERLDELREALRKDLKDFAGAELDVCERWSEQWVRRLSRGAKFGSVVNTVAPGAAALAHAGNVGDQLSRALGGVAFVGPAFSVAALFLRCFQLAAQAKEDRAALGAIYHRLPTVSKRLCVAVYSVLSSDVHMPEIVGGLFEAMERCWVVMYESEQHLMKPRRSQMWLTRRAATIEQAVDKIDVQLQFAHLSDPIAENRGRVELLEVQFEEQPRELVSATSRNADLPSMYSGPGKPKNIVREAIEQYEEVLASVCSGGLVSLFDAQSASVVTVEGAGGYGKTTTLLLLAHDRRVREHFSCIFFVELGVNVTDALAIEKLAHIADLIGKVSIAEKIRAMPAGEDRVQNAVDFLKTPLADATVLLILDNVWPRNAGRQWAEELSELVSKPGCAFLMSTRREELAEFADGGKRFSMGRVRSAVAARRILERHAGLEPGAAQPAKLGRVVVLDEDLERHTSVREFILKTCDGWPLALAMCGALIKASGYQWKLMGERLMSSLVEVSSAKIQVQHPGLQAVLQTNLKFAQGLPVDHALLLPLGNECRRAELLSRVDFSDLYKVLVVLGSSRSIPFYVLGTLFAVTDEEGEVVGRIFASTGLASLKVSSSDNSGRAHAQGLELVLHDIQHAFAEWLCVDSGSSVSEQHARLLRSSAKRFCGDGDAFDPGFDWSALCEHRDCGKGKGTLATHMCDELVRHILASSSGEPQDGSQVSRILGLLCSYKWIRSRGATFDGPTVSRDFAMAVAGLAIIETGVEPGMAKDGSNVAPFYGEVCALETIAEVLRRINVLLFIPDLPCEIHGERDTGLAAELYGRLAVLKFKQLDAAAQRDAQNVVSKLRASIQEIAQPPWLLPRFECYGSVERKDVRCLYGFPAGDGAVYGLAYVRRGGVDVLVSGGGDKSLRLHDIGACGRPVHVLSGHDDLVSDVYVVDKCSVGAARSTIIASSSYDGSVRLWGVEDGCRGEEQCLHVLQCSTQERLGCVAITPDAQRIVAGGGRHGDSGAAPDHATADRGEYRVHVWTRLGTMVCSSATADSGEYTTVALAGHTAEIVAVQVSHDGERFVSGSEDGTVCVWSLPPRAGLAAADVGAPRVVDLRAATPSHNGASVFALSLSADSKTAFAGMGGGSIHVVDCDSGRIEAPLRTDRTAGATVTCLALAEFDSNSTKRGGVVGGRLFAGHFNGVVSEWDLESRSCVTVFGDGRSGTGVVWSIAARVVPTAGEQRVEGDSEPEASATVAGDGGGGSGGGSAGGRCEVEFATGHGYGTARVWRAGGGAEYCSEEKPAMSDGPLVPEDRTAGCMSVPRRHVDIRGDTPSCMSASADGRWLVSGSVQGVVCAWDGYSGRCVATLLGHEATAACVDISDCGSIVASCSDDITARIWRWKDRAWSQPIVLQHDKVVVCLALTADGSRAITGDTDGVVRVWDAETGMLCEPVLSRHVASITTLLECRLARTYDGGGCGCDESLDVGAFDLEGPGARSPRATLCLGSRDVSGTCLLWNWPCTNPVKSSSEVPFEKPLQQVFLDELDLVETSRRREQRYWWEDRADKFTLRPSTETTSTGCEVGRGDTSLELEVLPSASPPDECRCVARVELDSFIRCSTLYAFERLKGGVLGTVVCCGLLNGTVAVFELVRLPE
jgi:WD40 repeat protein